MKDYGLNYEEIFKQVDWNKHWPDLSWNKIFDTIKNIPVTNEYELGWNQIDEEDFRKIFKHSAVKRTKYLGLKRNINQKGSLDK